MKCHKHSRRPAVALCLHCGVGICRECLLAARRDSKKGLPHQGCRHRPATPYRSLHEMRDQLRLLVRVQSALCIIATGPFLGLAIVVYWAGAWPLAVIIGVVAVMFTATGIIWWRRESRLYGRR